MKVSLLIPPVLRLSNSVLFQRFSTSGSGIRRARRLNSFSFRSVLLSWTRSDLTRGFTDGWDPFLSWFCFVIRSMWHVRNQDPLLLNGCIPRLTSCSINAWVMPPTGTDRQGCPLLQLSDHAHQRGSNWEGELRVRVTCR